MAAHGACRIARRLAIAMALVAAGVAGCGDDGPSGGSGPVGPVGPVGSVGPSDDGVDGLDGSGELVVQARSVQRFDRVVLAGEGAAIVAFGDQEMLTVETDDNLVDFIETTVEGGVLEIRTAQGVNIAPSNSVTYRITVKDLVAVELAGAGSIDVDQWSTEALRVVLSGVGDIRLGALESGDLVVDHTGVGSVTVAGTAAEQTVSVVGIGDYDASNLATVKASVRAAGTGSATVWVARTLEVVASDTGSVAFYGAPVVTQQIDGAATVTPLGAR